MTLVVRATAILFGFVLASIAAGFVVTLAVLLPEWSELPLGPIENGMLGIMLTFGVVFLSASALLPALIVVVLGESFSIRSVLFYAVAGAVVGLVTYVGMGRIEPESWTIGGLFRRELEVMTAAGIVGGWVYWAIAGRNAGAWRAPSSA